MLVFLSTLGSMIPCYRLHFFCMKCGNADGLHGTVYFVYTDQVSSKQVLRNSFKHTVKKDEFH